MALHKRPLHERLGLLQHSITLVGSWLPDTLGEKGKLSARSSRPQCLSPPSLQATFPTLLNAKTLLVNDYWYARFALVSHACFASSGSYSLGVYLAVNNHSVVPRRTSHILGPWASWEKGSEV
eukprot:2276841-Amphidinium_carterae.1